MLNTNINKIILVTLSDIQIKLRIQNTNFMS